MSHLLLRTDPLSLRQTNLIFDIVKGVASVPSPRMVDPTGLDSAETCLPPGRPALPGDLALEPSFWRLVWRALLWSRWELVWREPQPSRPGGFRWGHRRGRAM